MFSYSVFATNGKTTYQAKIVKPDGYPLEAASVTFKFTVLDTVGACVLYSEMYSAVDMRSTGGLISFALGNGARDFPASGTTAVFANVFDNSIVSMPCQAPGIYNPGPNDTRKIVMQFNDGTGWQTLPAMTINSVPYAMYAGLASNAKALNGKAAADFVEVSTLANLNCGVNQAIKFNNATFTCIDVPASGSGGITSVTTSGSVLVTGGTASAPVISIQAATLSQDGYLTSLDYAEFKAKLSASATQIINTLGFAPVSSSIVASQIASSTLAGDVSGNPGTTVVNSVAGKTAAQISTSVDATLAATASATAETLVKRNISGNATVNDLYANAVKINYVDIYKPTTSFNVRLQAPTSLSANYVLNLPTTSGTTGQVLSTDGIGNLSWINPPTGSVVSVSATAPLASTGGTTPTISISQATSGTDGYLSAADWNTFNNKQQATSAAIIATLGYAPATSTTLAASFVQKTGDTMTGLLNLAAGTTTTGSLKFTSGTLLTSAQSGTVEYDGSQLYFTDGLNIRRALATNSSPGSFENTSSISNSSGNITLSPNSTTGSVIVNSSAASISSGTGALVVNGGLGIAGSINAGGNLNLTGSATLGQSLTLSSLTSGSLLFAGASGLISEDNSSLFWDGATKRLGLGTNSPAQTFSVSGASYFSGNVGIGTSAPVSHLHIGGINRTLSLAGSIEPQGNASYLLMGNSDSAGVSGPTIMLSANRSTQFGVGDSFLSPTGGNFTSFMTINSSGNVGIGTTAPTVNFEVLRAQNFGGSGVMARFRHSPSVNEVIMRESGTIAHIYNTNNPRFVISSNGSSDFGLLSSNGAIGLGSGSTSGALMTNLSYIQGGGGLNFFTNGITSASVVMNSSGNVGIGTVSPIASLDVLAPDQSPAATFRNPSGLLRIIPFKINVFGNPAQQIDATYLQSGNGANNAAQPMILSGRSGVNLPSFNLFAADSFIRGDVRIGPGDISNIWPTPTLSDPFEVQSSAGTSLLIVKSTGQIGLETTTPTAKLHIAAGTSSTAPLKFTLGTLLSSPQSGTIEYDGSQLYFTDSSNTRRALASTVNPGSFENTNSISNTSGNISLNPNNSTGSVIVSATTASTNSTTGALVVRGGLGLSGNINSTGVGSFSSVIASGSVISDGFYTARETSANNSTNTPFNSQAGGYSYTEISPPAAGGPNTNSVIRFGRVGANVNNLSRSWIGAEYNFNFSSDLAFFVSRPFNIVRSETDSSRALTMTTNYVGVSNNQPLSNFSGKLSVNVGDFTNASVPNALTVSGAVAIGESYTHTAAPLNGAIIQGNVGIGTSTPLAPLDVRSRVSINRVTSDASATLSVGGAFRAHASSTAANYGEFATNDHDLFIRKNVIGGVWRGNIILQPNSSGLGSQGFVGIGTTTPSSKLEVVGEIRVPNNFGLASYRPAGQGGTATGLIYVGADDRTYVGHATGSLSLRTAASERLTIDVIGNIGIGTTTPNRKFHVLGSNTVANFQSDSVYSDIQFSNNINSSGFIQYNAGDFRFFANSPSVPTMTILGGAPGNVGIGTSSPNNNLTLGSNIVTQNSTGADRIYSTLGAQTNGSNYKVGSIKFIQPDTHYQDAGAIAFFSAYGAEVERMRITPLGNVGIGTTNPLSIMQVNSTDIENAHFAKVTGDTRIRIGRPGTAVTDNGIIGWNDTLKQLQLYISGAAAGSVLNVANGGNVGIGTVTPDAKLSVDASQSVLSDSGMFRLDDPNYPIDATTGRPGLSFGYDNSSDMGWIYSRRRGKAGTPLNLNATLYVQSGGGNVGIGTTAPNGLLDVRGGVTVGTLGKWGVRDNATGSQFVVEYHNGGVFSDANIKMVVNSAGQVGIGTAAPAYTLDVAGDVRATGSVAAWSDIRTKKNIEVIPASLQKILQIRGVSFDWRNSEFPEKNFKKDRDMGVIAQEVEKVFPEAVRTDNEGFKSVAYSILIAPVIEAIKELYGQVSGLKQENEKQKREISALKEKIIEVDQLKNENQILKDYLCKKDAKATFCTQN